MRRLDGGYPRIEAARGGKLSTIIETVDCFVTAFSQQPGHIEPIIPGRGPVATIASVGESSWSCVGGVRRRMGSSSVEGSGRRLTLRMTVAVWAAAVVATKHRAAAAISRAVILSTDVPRVVLEVGILRVLELVRQ